MGIEWFRDLSITMLGFVTMAVLIFITVLVYRLYREARSTLLLVKAASKSAYDTVTLVQEGIKPVLSGLVFIQGIRQGFERLSKILGIKKGGQENEQGTVG